MEIFVVWLRFLIVSKWRLIMKPCCQHARGRALEPQLYSALLPRVPAPIAYHYTQFIQCNVIVIRSQTKLSWDLSFLAATSRITQMQSLQSGASAQCGHSGFAWDKSGLFFFFVLLLFRLLFSVCLCLMLAILVIWILEEGSSGSQACMSISCCLNISSLARECSGTLPAASQAFFWGNHRGKFWISLKLNSQMLGKICMLFPL